MTTAFSGIQISRALRNQEILLITRTCPMCDKQHGFEIHAKDWFDGVLKYTGGALIQNAFPKLTASEREVLISGICDECWEKL